MTCLLTEVGGLGTARERRIDPETGLSRGFTRKQLEELATTLSEESSQNSQVYDVLNISKEDFDIEDAADRVAVIKKGLRNFIVDQKASFLSFPLPMQQLHCLKSSL